MTLNNVQDDILLRDIQIDDSVLQQVTTYDVIGVTVINKDLDQEAEETDDNSSSVPYTQLVFVQQAVVVKAENHFTLVDIAASEANDFDASARVIPDITQKIVILSDEEFDEVVGANLQIIKKKAWVAMEKGEKSFTHIISKSQKKKIKKLAQSGRKSYNTRSGGDTSHMSL
ncbi:hypothetical protein TSUD_251620 [Trifolium subterraneum]|uniref:Uncharacterized protein n=1 Tax=Trifolium subterraneum TaxID=3900 RepID=A0A2Z6LS68_TRISU|nr:hypothetical protein TSUD_251620 [Trifolium subterraneum]